MEMEPHSRCGWAGLGGGGLGAGVCGWMTDDVDRAGEVRDGPCYQPSRRQACLCDVCAVAPYFIALFLSVLHLWSTTHAAEMGFEAHPLSFSLFFFCHHLPFDSHPLANSLHQQENKPNSVVSL